MRPITPPKSLMELTAERIREAIFAGELSFGSKVSEQSLSDMLCVSRSPVREALALLQMEGLVRVLPKKGTFIFTPDEKSVEDLCDHRAMLEAGCLALAITRNHKQLIAGLKHGMDLMSDAIERSDSKAFAAGDMKFHQAIIESSGNQSVGNAYTRTVGPILAVRTHLFSLMSSHLERSMAEHHRFLQACEDKDIQHAQEINNTHIMHLTEVFRSAHESTDASDTATLRLIK